MPRLPFHDILYEVRSRPSVFSYINGDSLRGQELPFLADAIPLVVVGRR